MNKLLYILLILLSMVQVFGQSEEKIALNKGIDAYKKGDFTTALKYFNKAEATNPDYKKAIFDAANAALLIDSIAIAKDLYTEYASAVNDKIEKSKAYYNLGNTQFKEYEKLAKNPDKSQESTRVLKESIESYKKALRNNYKDKDARYNLSLAMSKLPPENKKDKNQDQKNQDQKNQQDENQQDGNDSDKDKKEGEDGGEKKNEDEKKDGDKPDDKKDGKGDNKEDEEEGDKSKEEQENKEGKNGEKNKEEEGKQGENKQEGKQGEKGKEEEMKGKISLMQAQKDLDAMNNEEQKTLLKVNRKKGNHKKENTSSKDW